MTSGRTNASDSIALPLYFVLYKHLIHIEYSHTYRAWHPPTDARARQLTQTHERTDPPTHIHHQLSYALQTQKKPGAKEKMHFKELFTHALLSLLYRSTQNRRNNQRAPLEAPHSLFQIKPTLNEVSYTSASLLSKRNLEVRCSASAW